MENEFEGNNSEYGEASKQECFLIQKKGDSLLHHRGPLFSILFSNWALPVHGKIIKFYTLIFVFSRLAAVSY